MEVYIIGYSWCKHFQNAIEKLNAVFKSVHSVKIMSDTPNRMLIRQTTAKIVGTHTCIGSPASTSPQILVCTDNSVVCIPGEEELMYIGPENVSAFVHRACSEARAVLVHRA